MNPAVIGTDVVERKVTKGVLITHRLVSSKWFFPRWAQAVSLKIIPSQFINHFLSIADLEIKTVVGTSKNFKGQIMITLADF